MRSPAAILCILIILAAGLPARQALSASKEASATLEMAQGAPAPQESPRDLAPPHSKTWPMGPKFGNDAPRMLMPQEPETPGPRKSESLGKSREPAKPKVDDKAAKAEALKKAMAPHPSVAQQREQVLASLFKRLAAANDPDEARVVAATIQRVWSHSQSDTANLLMERASAAMAARQFPLALELFNKIIALEPNWAEAWNKRATLRYLGDDLDGSMADIKQVLKLEPRHFGALAGMGMILRKEGFDKDALAVFRKVLALNPQQPELRSSVEKLALEVEGRDI